MDATKPFYKQPSFWIALVMTNLSLLLQNGYITDNTYAQPAGWVLTILTVLGYRALAPKVEEPSTTTTVTGA